jgi:hypothetical protein
LNYKYVQYYLPSNIQSKTNLRRKFFVMQISHCVDRFYGESVYVEQKHIETLKKKPQPVNFFYAVRLKYIIPIFNMITFVAMVISQTLESQDN